VLIPDIDDFERYKWSSNTERLAVAENSRLVGYRRAAAIARVRDELGRRKQPHTAAAVSKWFKTVKLDEAMSDKVAERYLRIHSRISAVKGLPQVLEDMESILGTKHVLTNSSTLDMIVGASKCKTEALQSKLLEWLISGIFVHFLRTGTTTMNRDAIKDKMNELILKRKVIVYLAQQFPFRDETDRIYVPGRSPSQVLAMCMKPLQFHELFPAGTPVGPPVDPVGTGWKTDLCEWQDLMLNFIRDGGWIHTTTACDRALCSRSPRRARELRVACVCCAPSTQGPHGRYALR
jgi:hypothetical protein